MVRQRENNAMKQRSEVEADNIPDVVSFFGVGLSRGIAPIKNGIANHNYVVSTDQGNFVVKFLVTQPPENIENDVAIQQQLSQAGVGSPHYLRNRDGDYLYRGHDNLNAVISEKLDGVSPRQMSADLVSGIGRHLALFHTSVVACPNPNQAGSLMNPGMSGDNTGWARTLLDQPLPRGIIHGDLHSGNVLVDPRHRDRVIALLDFEEAGENLYLIDLAVTLMSVSSSTSREAIEPELMRAAKQGYETVRRLTDQEVVWLPWAIRYTSEAWITWFVANGFDEYARKHQRRYDGFREVFGEHLAV